MHDLIWSQMVTLLFHSKKPTVTNSTVWLLEEIDRRAAGEVGHGSEGERLEEQKGWRYARSVLRIFCFTTAFSI